MKEELNGSCLLGEYVKHIDSIEISGDEEMFLLLIAKRTIMYLDRWSSIDRKDFHKYFGENKRKKIKNLLTEKKLIKHKPSSINGQRAFDNYSIVINDKFWNNYSHLVPERE